MARAAGGVLAVSVLCPNPSCIPEAPAAGHRSQTGQRLRLPSCPGLQEENDQKIYLCIYQHFF